MSLSRFSERTSRNKPVSAFQESSGTDTRVPTGVSRVLQQNRFVLLWSGVDFVQRPSLEHLMYPAALRSTSDGLQVSARGGAPLQEGRPSVPPQKFR